MASVYVETTVLSYLVAKPSRDLVIAAHQQITQEWWTIAKDQFNLYVSVAVLAELARGDAEFAERRLAAVEALDVLIPHPHVENLIAEYSERLGMTGTAMNDLPHFAFAVAYQMDFLETWNCRHIANGHVIRRLHSVNDQLGHETPIILTPEELLTSYPGETAG
jgi:hypothetical protein